MTTINGTMMQFFHWYIPTDGSLWNQVTAASAELAKAGFTALWLPPRLQSQWRSDGCGLWAL
jgi:alpha-amylase